MSFDKTYKKRKDRRKAYRGSKTFDRSCRNHGSCGYCLSNRLHSSNRRKQSAIIEFDDNQEPIDSNFNTPDTMIEYD